MCVYDTSMLICALWGMLICILSAYLYHKHTYVYITNTTHICICLCVCITHICIYHKHKTMYIYTCGFKTQLCISIHTYWNQYAGMRPMRWLRLVGPLKLWVSFATEPYKRDDILQKRPMILRSLLIVTTRYQHTCIVNTRVYRSQTQDTYVYTYVCV